MKKSLIALAVLASIAGVAQAQSAVTIYGKVDVGVTKLSGDILTPTQEATKMKGNHTSRIGVKGSEDLGNGMSAIFQVESRFNADDGTIATPGEAFSGPAYVGLGGNFGQVRLGRNYGTMDVISSAAIDPFEGDGIGGMNALTRARINNTLTYYTPEMSGFGAQAQYILGEKPVGVLAANQNDGYAVGVNYNNGPIYLGAGYGVEENSNDSNIWAVSGSYAFGPAKIALGYDQLDNKIGTQPKAKNAVVAATYEIGSGVIKAAYGQTKDGVADTFGATAPGVGNTFDKIQKLSIGYQHNMSKRTSLYADVARTRYTDPGFKESVNGVGIGVTHNF